jgi:nicotinate-nucleotide adenylyltransferase
MKRIGILGGTFDPPHAGHIELANAAKESLQLDEVIFVPAFKNPLKPRKATSSKQRLEMVRLALENEPAFSYSDIEISRGGPSYTIDTVSELSYVQPADYWVIIGSDALVEIESWKNWQRLLKLAKLAVAVRPPQTSNQLSEMLSAEVLPRIDWISMPPRDLSSTEIRLRIQEGRPTHGLLASNVLGYIQREKLYRS